MKEDLGKNPKRLSKQLVTSKVVAKKKKKLEEKQ